MGESRKRPEGYPKLQNYEPSRFMLPTSHYDKEKADRAVRFVEMLPHTKGEWEGQPFWLLPWQEMIIRDLFGVVKEDGMRQFRTAYIEIPKKQGKTELAAAITLYLLYADNEPSAEVFSAAADRAQASIVYDVARRMVEMTPALMKRSKIMAATKRIVNYSNAGYYQVVSADVANKHGYSISGLCFDEIHNQPNRKLWDVLTKGSGDARRQALHVAITTAGTDRNSICYELHCKAQDILKGRKSDSTFYPVVYSLPDDSDWTSEQSWRSVNPSIGYTVPIERMREAFLQAQENPAEENVFRQLRLCQWVGSTVAWVPEHIYDKGCMPINEEQLRGRECYAGLDLSSTSDITAFVMVFPPRTSTGKYFVLPHFWLPRETLEYRVRRDRVPYDVWERQGLFHVTEGNVVDYNFVRKTINELGTRYHIMEIGVDRWNATQLITDLDGDGFTMVPIGMGFKDMSPGMKELYKLLLEGRIVHGGNPVLRWMAGNVVAEIDAAENIKPSKKKSTEKIDGIVAMIMGLDRAIRHERQQGSVYDDPNRGLLVFLREVMPEGGKKINPEDIVGQR